MVGYIKATVSNFVSTDLKVETVGLHEKLLNFYQSTRLDTQQFSISPLVNPNEHHKLQYSLTSSATFKDNL